MKHSFDVQTAEKYGVIEAILIEYIAYWVNANEKKRVNYYDGRYWTYNSIQTFHKVFPYISQSKIITALRHLKVEGLILTGNYNNSAYDRTLWYTLSDKGNQIYRNGKDELKGIL